MNEQDLVRLYALGANRPSTSRADCATPEALLAAVEHSGSEDERMKTIKDEAGFNEAHDAYVRAVTRLAVARGQRAPGA